MGIKNNVFASRSERDNFYKLCRTWGDKYRIYHNLPFLNVFDTEKLVDRSDWKNPRPFELSELEIARLKKTSIDYTLCDDKDTPIVCIEFDGMQQGYNVWTKYYPNKMNSQIAPWRKEITELKLSVALGSFFPYFVVGSKYFQDIPGETSLTIVDGIIGYVLIFRVLEEEMKSIRDSPVIKLKQEFTSFFGPLHKTEWEEEVWRKVENYDSLTKQEEAELWELWLHCINIRADGEYNPINIRKNELTRELGIGISSYRSEWLPPPTYPPEDDEEFKNSILIGARVFVMTPDFGEVKGEAWLANFGFWVGRSLVDDIAHLYALERIKQMMLNKQRTR